jgi:hypothetical protein
VDVELRVVIEGGGLRFALACQIQIMLSGIGPPWLECLLVKISSVSLVVQPQTEAGSSQSIWPDLGVLSVTTDRSGEPLATQVIGDLAMCPGEGVLTVTDHLEGAIPAIVGVDH